MADQFLGTAQQEQLLRVAEGYDVLARNAEAWQRRAPCRTAAEAGRVSGPDRDTSTDHRP